jgi:hypothetical protein
MDQDTLRSLGQELREGQRVRVSHGCGEGRTLLVSRDGARVRGWCFRCNEAVGASLVLSVQEHLSRLAPARESDAEFAGSLEPPSTDLDMARWPTAARLWMFRAGFSEDSVRGLGIGWSQDMQRTVLPITDRHGERVSWTARAHDGRLPKYLTGSLPDGFVAERPGRGPPVATEDWLSALKLGLCGVHAISMLGTHPKPAVLLRLLDFKELFVWLDNDLPPKHRINSGQIHARKLCATLHAFGRSPANVVSNQEPKELDRASILSVLARCATAYTPSASAQDGESNERLP